MLCMMDPKRYTEEHGNRQVPVHKEEQLESARARIAELEAELARLRAGDGQDGEQSQ